MKRLIKKIPGAIALHHAFRSIAAYLRFLSDFSRFRAMNAGKRLPVKWSDHYACLHDRTAATSFDRHYIYHPAWAARILAGTKPSLHVDISSSLHFCSIISAFIPVHFYDYRPADLGLDKLHSEHADLLALPFPDNSIASLSCMHVVEHVGLGRYGDPLDPDGDLKAIDELQRVMAKGGDLLLVVPVGKPGRIMFNAHRIYEYDQLLEYFKGMKLQEFALIPDNADQGGLVRNASKQLAGSQKYGCGCFWFRKN